MKNWLTKYKFILPIIAAVILVLPRAAHAQFFSIAADSAFNLLLSIINLIVNFVGTILISLAASIVNYVFSFQNFVKVPVVQIGWTLSRDLANMMFILVLLGIAFAYILRLETFGMKKLLPKLIIMALVLNFSLVVCGVFIDMGNSLGHFFVSGSGTANVGDNIMAAVKAGQLAQMRNGVTQTGAPVTSLIMASIIQLIFYIILAFLLFAMGFMMLYRIINLWLLIILAPLAWVCIAVPQMSSYYSSWWSRFLKQAFFPVVLGFFIFLGLLTGSTFAGADISQGVKDVGGWGYILPETFLSAIMQFIVVISILFIGLSSSQKWGASGAEKMMKFAKDGQKWATGKVTSKAKMAAGSLAKKALYDDKGNARAGIGLANRGLQKISGVPIAGGALGFLGGKALGGALAIPSKLIDQRKKVIEDEEGKVKKNSTQTIRLTFSALSAEGQAAALRVLADRGDIEINSEDDIKAKHFGNKDPKKLTEEEKKYELSDTEKKEVGTLHPTKNGSITEKTFKSALELNGSAGLEKEILNAAPQFAWIVGKTIKEVIEKMSPSKAEKIQRGSLELVEIKNAIRDAIIGKSWDSGQLSGITRNNPKAGANLVDSMEVMLKKHFETEIKENKKKDPEITEALQKIANLTDAKAKDKAWEKLLLSQMNKSLNKKTVQYIFGTPSKAMGEDEEEVGNKKPDREETKEEKKEEEKPKT